MEEFLLNHHSQRKAYAHLGISLNMTNDILINIVGCIILDLQVGLKEVLIVPYHLSFR